MSENDGFVTWCVREAFSAGASWQAKRYELLVRAAEAVIADYDVDDVVHEASIAELRAALDEARGEQ